MIKEILLPDLGEGIDSAEVSEVLVSHGKTIKADDIILVLESEKASMEIPAETGGKVKKVLVVPGDTVTTGQCLITLETTGKKTSKQKVKEQKDQARPATRVTIEKKKQRKVKRDRDKVFASPGVRRLSRELKIDLQTIKGMGPKGRVTKEDLHNFIRNKMEGLGGSPYRPGPEIDFSQWGKIATQKLTKIKRITARRMQQSWQTIPHVTQFDEADITDLHAHRQKLNKDMDTKKNKVTFLPFFMKAAARLLKEMPTFNSSLDSAGESLILKHYFHIGVAVGVDDGLVVPVIKFADSESLHSINSMVRDFAVRAKSKKLRPDEIEGSTFTISNLGMFGIKEFTSIINQPNSAILSVGSIIKKPVVIDDKITIGNTMKLTLACDHRTIDGVTGSLFLQTLKGYLENPVTILV